MHNTQYFRTILSHLIWSQVYSSTAQYSGVDNRKHMYVQKTL